jgi:hypothetical protein
MGDCQGAHATFRYPKRSHFAHDPDTTDAERIQGIIELKYTPADLSKIVEECTHLQQAEQQQLLMLQK